MLLYLADPSAFLELNYAEITALIRSVCMKQKLQEHEDEIGQRFFLEYLNGDYKYNPDHVVKDHPERKACLSTFLYQMIFYSVLDFRKDEKKKSREAEFEDDLYDTIPYREDLETIENAQLDSYERFLKTTSRKGVGKKLGRSICLHVFQRIRQGYNNKEIAKEFDVTEMAISHILNEVRDHLHLIHKESCHA